MLPSNQNFDTFFCSKTELFRLEKLKFWQILTLLAQKLNSFDRKTQHFYIFLPQNQNGYLQTKILTLFLLQNWTISTGKTKILTNFDTFGPKTEQFWPENPTFLHLFTSEPKLLPSNQNFHIFFCPKTEQFRPENPKFWQIVTLFAPKLNNFDRKNQHFYIIYLITKIVTFKPKFWHFFCPKTEQFRPEKPKFWQFSTFKPKFWHFFVQKLNNFDRKNQFFWNFWPHNQNLEL